jgi:glycosyltransferase involved in cell wall biosynthesis
MKKIKIGIDIRAIGCQRTGDEFYTLNLVKNLLEIDKKNNYYLFTNTKEEGKIEEIKRKISGGEKFPENARIIPILPAYKLLWTFVLLPYQAFKLKLDILHLQYITPIFLPGKTKIVTTIHDISFARFPEKIQKTDLFFLKTLIPLSIKKASKIIGVSDFTKNEIMDYYGLTEEKVIAVKNGGADERLLSGNQKKESFQDKRPYIFFMGTHQPRKNIPVLIRAFAELKKKYGDREGAARKLKLVIGGKRNGRNSDHKIEKTIDSMKENKEDIIFTDYIDDEKLSSYYSNAECFVFPSLYEGFGLPLLEAMFLETPVICSDIPCFREIAGDAALFFEPDNEKDLSEKIFQVIIDQSLKRKLIQKGKERERKFLWEKCAEETLQTYIETL